MEEPAPESTDELYARFRRSGDAEVLRRCSTAPELLRVASHLCHDPHAAEDLVQTTFVVAIEARAYDPSRPVLPWLLGILANRARKLRREQRRAMDPRAG